jgi:hypothetical protein
VSLISELPRIVPYGGRRSGGGGGGGVWPPLPRGPLPAFPPGAYDRTLPSTPPTGPDLLFYRGQFCGIRTPEGFPLLPGMAGYTVAPWSANRKPWQPPVMAPDIPRYWQRDPSLAKELLTIYAQVDGYTHLMCSVGHAVESGFTIDQWVEYCGLVQSFGLFADQWWLGGGPWHERDADVMYWRPILQPWMDAVKANKVVDASCVGWQLDAYNKGTERLIDGRMQSPIQSIIDYCADQLGPYDIPLGTHWAESESGAWNDPYDRFKWWRDQRNKLTWFHHQGDVDIPVDLYQAKLCDTLNPFGDGRMGRSGLFGDRPYALVIYECSAQGQFGTETRNPWITEDEGDLRSYLLNCTRAASNCMQYGNGSRMPNGSVL